MFSTHALYTRHQYVCVYETSESALLTAFHEKKIFSEVEPLTDG